MIYRSFYYNYTNTQINKRNQTRVFLEQFAPKDFHLNKKIQGKPPTTPKYRSQLPATMKTMIRSNGETILPKNFQISFTSDTTQNLSIHSSIYKHYFRLHVHLITI